MKNLPGIIDPFLDSFIRICPEISNEELGYLKDEVSVSRFKKKDFYLKPGFTQKEIGFVNTGLIRAFYIDDTGRTITTSFIKEGEYATDYLSFIKQVKTKYFFECLEDCLIINLSYSSMQNGYKKFKVFEKYGRIIAETVLEARINRVESFLLNNAEERYKMFVNENAGLVNRITLTHLSSFLGIERQSLTRIRNKMTNSSK